MAYAQQPRYGGPQRPNYKHQQASYASSAQPYAAEYDYADGNQGGQYNEDRRAGPSRQYSDPHSQQTGGYRNDQEAWQAGGATYAHGGQYGGRGQQGGGRQPAQQHHSGPMKQGGYTHGDPRSQRPPQPRSRFPPKDRYQQQDPGYEPSRQPESPHHQQQYPPGQETWQPNGGYGYDDQSYAAQDNWTPMQEHYPEPSYNGASGYHASQQHAGYQQQESLGGYDRGVSPDERGHPSNAPTSRHETSAPRSTKGQSQGSSTRSESTQHSKAPPKRIIETPMSPDTIAWDNPFPTFPMRPKKGAHSSSKIVDGSSGGSTMKDGPVQEKVLESRPQTASSKGSSHSVPRDRVFEESNGYSSNQHIGHDGSQPRWPKGTEQNRDVIQARPSTSGNDHSGGHFDQLKPPPVVGRHSEDNRTRPSIRNDSVFDSGYGRSRTMPTAVSEGVVKPGYQPTPSDQLARHEPGPVAGYHGPEDRGYLPASPVDGPRQRPYGQPKAQYDERRPHGHVAIGTPPAQKLNHPQSHAPHDSLGDFFDDYYDTGQQNQQPSMQDQRNKHRSPVDKEMPNFDAIPDPGAIHRRGLTIDEHLQPQYKPQEYPPMPAPPRQHERGDMRRDPNYRDQVSPRSKSQPNLKDRRSPREENFDFGIPGNPGRSPATAPAPGGYGGGNDLAMGNPNDRPHTRDRPPIGRGPQGPMLVAGYGPESRNGSSYPPPRAGLPPIPYQSNDPTDRYRSPPLQDGRSQGAPMRPPVGGPSPIDRNMANGLPPLGYQNGAPPDRFRSPPTQDSRSRGTHVRPPGGGPSPIDRTGPTLPPTRTPSNPDALPSHPAPFRPGLMEGSPVNQAAKPPPVRQYNAAPSPMQASNPTRKGSSHSTDDRGDSVPVTHQELEQLRQATARRPDDMATQLTLAKKLVEAATVLVDERADPRAKSRAREKYIADAYKIVKKLSGNGHTEANFYLADAYSRGSLGLEADTREAFRYYQAAAKAGHAQAAYRVAVCCEIGQEEGGGTSRDAVKAMQWYKRAATLGDTPAMYKMGIISLKGLLGQPKNPREALVWLKKAADRADRENPHALHELALLHEKPTGNEGIHKDETYSRQLFTQAAKLGYKFSQFRLGCAYEYGLLGCPVDPRQSIAWYSKAAVQEEHQSELALSGWYLTGSEGVLQQSDTEAYLWARKAAQAGLAKAEYAMGYFTEVGIGAPANLDDAKRWYWRAASQNFQKAREKLEDLRKGGGTKQRVRVSRSNMKKQSDGECLVM